VVIVPLDGERAAEPARRRRVVGAGDFDVAVEMHGARPVLVVAKRLERQRSEVRLLLGEHGGDLALGGAVDTGVGPARVPAIEIGLRLLQAFEAQALERRGLGVADGGLDLALAIGVADATGQRDDAVMREDVPIERVERGVIDVRREHALLEVVEDGAACSIRR